MTQQLIKGSQWMRVEADSVSESYPTEDYSNPTGGSTATLTAGSSALVDAQAVVIDKVFVDGNFTATAPTVTFTDQGGAVLFAVRLGAISTGTHVAHLGLMVPGGFAAEVGGAFSEEIVVVYHTISKDRR